MTEQLVNTSSNAGIGILVALVVIMFLEAAIFAVIAYILNLILCNSKGKRRRNIKITPIN